MQKEYEVNGTVLFWVPRILEASVPTLFLKNRNAFIWNAIVWNAFFYFFAKMDLYFSFLFPLPTTVFHQKGTRQEHDRKNQEERKRNECVPQEFLFSTFFALKMGKNQPKILKFFPIYQLSLLDFGLDQDINRKYFY